MKEQKYGSYREYLEEKGELDSYLKSVMNRRGDELVECLRSALEHIGDDNSYKAVRLISETAGYRPIRDRYAASSNIDQEVMETLDWMMKMDVHYLDKFFVGPFLGEEVLVTDKSTAKRKIVKVLGLGSEAKDWRATPAN
ncbi:TPA: hypothetical protein ACGSTL_001257 [Vibrio parahaemolyticus]|uniref:hypothetical protein n=1 Tax=Vibrio campbellii TaxID=680 RepID=UPI001F08311B|nr:hypothetical protein [Vibrio campbellii]UMM06675.1 hypothetical protein MKR81_27390 [Vibrio campbellii]